MTSNFADRLSAAILGKQSQVCVGLDPRIDRMPKHLLERYRALEPSGCGCGRKEAAACLEEFCADVIDAVAPHAVAVKLQLACFEQYSAPGFRAFRHLVKKASKAGLIVIADAKRGDIGISAGAYSSAFLGAPDGLDGRLNSLEIDALTVNPLFGGDGIEPFINDCGKYGKGIFILVRTSNAGAAQLQDLRLESGELWHEHLAGMVDGWGRDLIGKEGYSSVGAVVGATEPVALARLRALLPKAILLLPGYGAQGAGPAEVAPAFDSRGLGALVTASRSIIYAGSGEDYAGAAGKAAARMRAQLWQVRS
ncbi:MAG: orotidine-5'-phosphate decarboxylase [Thermoleophilia bacterium]|jgi:orotidine-5'-phosphate decarboxylase